MSPDVESLVFTLIKGGWETLPIDCRPDKMWIARHSEMAGVEDSINTPVEAAWFWDGKVFSSRLPLDYVRFMAVQSGGFWYSGMGSVPASVFHGGVREFGLANFASVGANAGVYVETVYAGAHASGVLYSLREGELVPESVRWLA